MSIPSTTYRRFQRSRFFRDRPKGSHSGFNEGQFVLHLNSALSSKVSFSGELIFTARPDAGTGSPPATGFNVGVERSIIRSEQNDYFKVSFGRYHTPINYWNTRSIMGSGCKPRLVVRKWCSLAAVSSRFISWELWWKERSRRTDEFQL